MWMIVRCGVFVVLVGVAATEVRAEEVDASSIRQKVLCGYQGWFRCPGDGSCQAGPTGAGSVTASHQLR
jgi:hypothetical protein